MSVDDVVGRISEFRAASHCVLTGGEPMMAREIGELATRLRKIGKHITIETAGTVSPDQIPCDLASLSPKLAHSTPLEGEISEQWRERHENLRLQPQVLREWIENYEFQLKFVLRNSSDAEEMQDLLNSLDRDVPPHKILIMPEGLNSTDLREKGSELIELCKSNGYRFCHRLHIDLFGNTPGT